MTDSIREIAGARVLVCTADGPLLASERDRDEVLSAAWGHEAGMVAMPTARLAPDFFRLETRLAGTVTQKFVNYSLRLAIIGDISAEIAASRALRDFVHEANKGRMLWFVHDVGELEARLSAA